MAFVLAQTLDGKKITTIVVEFVNSGTAAADVRQTAYVKNVQRVIDVLGVVRLDKNCSNVHVNGIVSPNGIDITAESVAAGSTAKVKVSVLAV